MSLLGNDTAYIDVIISQNLQKLSYFLEFVYYILILGNIVNKFSLDFKEKSCNWKFGKLSSYAAEKYESNLNKMVVGCFVSYNPHLTSK